MIVTLIGSRNLPKFYYPICNRIGKILSDRGCIARSGGALGADTEFLRYYNSNLTEVYLPWRLYNNQSGIVINTEYGAKYIKDLCDYNKLSNGVKKLFLRNVNQILGKDFNTPSDLVIYYGNENKGKVSGGTGIAVELARKFNIPTINIKNKYSEENKLWEI